MKRAVVIGLLAFLLLPGGAQAAPFTPRLNLAFKLAERYWGQYPSGCASLETAVVPADSLSGEALGMAHPAPNCLIEIDRDLARPELYGAACVTVFHEYGHLLGLGHDADPRSVMSNPTPDADEVPYCRGSSHLNESLLLAKVPPCDPAIQECNQANLSAQRRDRTRRARRIARRFWAPLNA